MKKNKKWVAISGVVLAVLLASVLTLTWVAPTQWATPIIGQGQMSFVIGHTAYAAGELDYTCDGADDNVQFQAALNALPAGGGKLVVLAGSYSFSSTVTRAISNVTIEGVGRSTSFTYDASNPIFTAGGNNWVFRDFITDAGGVSVGATTGWAKENLVEGTTFMALQVSGNITPSDNNTHSLGTPDLRWGAIWTDNTSIHLGDIELWERGGCLATKHFTAMGRDGASGYIKIVAGTTPTHLSAGDAVLWSANASAGEFYFQTDNGTNLEVVRLDSNGRLGIGTDNSTELLHIKSAGGSELQYGLKLQNPEGGGSGATGILFQVATAMGQTSEKGAIAFERTKTFGRGNILFLLNDETNSNSVNLTDVIMAITPGGGVGIGTQPDNAWFHIEQDGTSIGFVRLTDTQVGGQEFWINNGNGSAGGVGKAGFYYGGSQRMSFDASTGYVGIGTTNATYALDVVGTLRANADMRIGNRLYHDGDTDTFISFLTDDVYIKVGSQQLLHLDEDASFAKLGDGLVDVNINEGNMFIGGSEGSYSGKVGIGVVDPATKLEVNGYTMLGSDAPAIKVKYFTGTTDPDNMTVFNHNIADASTKIILVAALVYNSTQSAFIAPNDYANMTYGLFHGTTLIQLTNVDTDLQSQTYKVLIIYQE